MEVIDRDSGVASADNKREAISYQVRDEHMTPEDGDNRPSAVYKRVFTAGAREHKLPPYYVKKYIH